MKRSQSTSIASTAFVITLVASATLSARGAEIAYEGFAYGATPNLAGANGGSGWSGQWFKLSSIPTGATTEGLALSGLPASGGAAFTAPYASADYTRYSRALAPYDAPGDVLYVSFLFRPNPGFGVGGGLAFGPWENGMVVGLVPGGGSYGLSGFTGPASMSSSPAQLGETVLLVASARKTRNGMITWALHVDPSTDAPEPSTPAATMSIPGTTLPQAVVLYNDGGYSTDEIRVATTWASVLGQSSAECASDLDGDSLVGSADLAIVLGGWGGGGSADLNGDGVVGAADLAILLGSWGACP